MLVTNDVADTREVGFGDQTRATTHVALGHHCHAQQVGYGHHRHVQQEESKRSLSIRDAYNGLPGTTDDVRAGECIMFYRPSGTAGTIAHNTRNGDYDDGEARLQLCALGGVFADGDLKMVSVFTEEELVCMMTCFDGFVIVGVATSAKWRRQATEMPSTRACETCTIHTRQAGHAIDMVSKYNHPTTFKSLRSPRRWFHRSCHNAWAHGDHDVGTCHATVK